MPGSNESPLVVAGSLRRSWRNAGVPTNGTSGTYAGIAEPGDLLIDTTNMGLYQNTNTQASPTWSKVFTGGPITDKAAYTFLATSEAGIVTVSADNIYVYLPTYVGNAGLLYTIKVTATFASGVVIKVTDAGTIDGAASKTSSAIYDMLSVVCGATEWRVIGKIGTWS